MNTNNETSSSDQIFSERYQNLNPQQQKAVDTIDGPVLVIAGPGSGKTELLSLRVANILRQTDTLPSSILCLTFTDSASVNMQKRLESLIGPESYKVAIHTFHSFGREIIAQNPEYFYHGANYSPADEITQIRILQDIFETLPHTNKLGGYHPDQGFTYLKEVKSRIGELKKGGLGPQEFRALLEMNKQFLEQSAPLIAEVFAERIDKSVLPKIAALVENLSKLQSSASQPTAPQTGEFKNLRDLVIGSLTLALHQAQDSEKISTKPITQWKEKFTKKDEKKKTILKDADRLHKNFDLADVYEQYIKKLHQDGLYDYDDMLLDVVKVLETKADLRFTLQEKFLYVLVDEFQDTNGVQMRLMDLLLDSELNEGRPNIMAVGDDDQSIYKFQGSNIENILSFHQKFRDPQIVVLTNNYRSTQGILDFARKVILQGEDRLENRLEGAITKDLVAARANLPDGLLVEKEFDTGFEELFWIAQHIQEMLKEKKCRPSDIALLAPMHRILEQAAKVMNFFGIPVAYERKQNLLEERYIHEIITILQFVDSMHRKENEEADYLLPEILGFEFWGVNRITLWRLAAAVRKSRKGWVENMLTSESKYLQSIAKFLIELAADANEKTAEEIIDLITGVEASKLSNDEQDEGLDQGAFALGDDDHFRSPFKQHYFAEKNISSTKSEYFEHLQNLQAFVSKIREYNAGNTLFVHDVTEFVRLLKNNKIPLNHTLDFSTGDDAVQIMTVHKAKGMEFDAVFVLNCQDDTWVRRRAEKLQFVSNLPLSPENESPEDVLRLFYVAITRAKHSLFLTRHRFNDNGKEQVLLRFLSDQSGESDEAASKQKTAAMNIEEVRARFIKEYGAEKFFELPVDIRRHQPRSEDENHLLKGLLQNYRLSVTHLINFLNVVDAGPHIFLEQNLLRFPQMMSPSGAFGTAMHEALAGFYNEYKISKKLPSLEYLHKQFEESLKMQRLNKNEFKNRLEKGRHDLTIFYEQRKESFDPRDKVEVNFISQQVVVNGATLNGQIDRIHLDDATKEITVIDYKTGKPFQDWESTDEWTQLKSWKYQLQLEFYKILVEHSREYRGKIVNKGVLEFLEPKNDEVYSLDLNISREAVERLEKLVGVVYKKILALDFPDIGKYDKDVFGIGVFIEDLLAGRV